MELSDAAAANPKAIIACPFCGEEVLVAARICKHCKSILKPGTASKAAVVVEMTSKRWKLLQLISIGIFFASMGLAAIGILATVPALTMIGAPGVILGGVVFLFARIMSWWHHG